MRRRIIAVTLGILGVTAILAVPQSVPEKTGNPVGSRWSVERERRAEGPASILVRVLDREGEPVPDATVAVLVAGPGRERTDSRGEVEFVFETARDLPWKSDEGVVVLAFTDDRIALTDPVPFGASSSGGVSAEGRWDQRWRFEARTHGARSGPASATIGTSHNHSTCVDPVTTREPRRSAS